MKHLLFTFSVLLLLGCEPAEFQKFSDEALINGRWFVSDTNEEIIFDTEANTYYMNGAPPLKYKHIDNDGEFTINGLISDKDFVRA